MKQLEYRLRKFLQEMGADLIGVGDVADLAPDSCPVLSRSLKLCLFTYWSRKFQMALRRNMSIVIAKSIINWMPWPMQQN